MITLFSCKIYVVNALLFSEINLTFISFKIKFSSFSTFADIINEG